MEKRENINLNIPDFVCEIIERISASDERAYLVGGSLRDMLLSKEPHDFDLASSASPEKICEIFSDMRVIKTGIAHGTVTLLSRGGSVEITTFRVDGAYTDMRHPESVKFTRRIEDDLSRRDFTVNAMAYNKKDRLIDLFGGASDIENKIIRTVGAPEERFTEDALRIMRAFRFSAQLGFDIEKKTLEAAGKMRCGLECIARERIFSELIRLLTSEYPESALRLMEKVDVFKTILPQYTVSERVFSLISKVSNSDVARLSAFFCDSEPTKIREMLSSLKASNRQKRAAVIVEEARKSYSSRFDVARLKSRMGEDAATVLYLSVLLGNSFEDVLLYIDDKTPYSISQLAIDGAELASVGLCGKEIGEALAFLLECVMRDPALNQRESLLKLAKNKFIKNDREV